jgi:4-amino-4-deoxy-L-arabinose transferase-like glycosyltransferase
METVVVDRKFGVRWQTAVSFLLLFAVLWGTGWWLYRSLIPYGSDTGLRFIQIRELIANGWQTLAVGYPGRLFDPELNHVPYYFAYSLVGDEIFLEITPFMPWLASWGYATLGVAGMMLVPALGGVLTAVAIYRLAQLSELPHPHLILWLTVFGTPLFFYSIELWDHTLAAAAAAWALYWLVKGVYQAQKRWLLLAGMALGLGLGQRPQMYMFALCLGGGFLLVNGRQWRLLLVVVGGGLVTAVPIWVWQYHMVGHPLGMALATNLLGYGAPPVPTASGADLPWSVKTGRKLFVVEARDPHTFLASILVVIGLILFLLVVRLKRWQRPILWWWAVGMFLLGYILYFVRVFMVDGLNGALAVFPLILVALLFVERTIDKRPFPLVYELVFSVTFIFFAAMIIVWPAYGGLQWGWRYLLPFFPLAVFLAFYNYHTLVETWQGWRGPLLKKIMISVILVSVALQAAAFHMQVNRHQYNETMRDGVAALSVDVIVTNGKYFPSEAASLDDRIFLYVRDSTDMPKLIERFGARGITEFAVVPLDAILLAAELNKGERPN